MPDEIRKKLVDEYGLSSYDASVISEEKDTSDFFFSACDGKDGKLVSNWLTTELFGSLNKNNLKIEDSPISPEQLGELVDFISDGTISGRIAKDVFAEMFETKKNPSKVIDEKGLKQISSSDDLIPMIERVISNNLDKDIAQHPQELITYGGNGSVFQNWAQYLLTMQYLSKNFKKLRRPEDKQEAESNPELDRIKALSFYQ